MFVHPLVYFILNTIYCNEYQLKFTQTSPVPSTIIYVAERAHRVDAIYNLLKISIKFSRTYVVFVESVSQPHLQSNLKPYRTRYGELKSYKASTSLAV